MEEWPKCIIDEFSNKFWTNEKGKYHREGGPACEWATGIKEWFINGKLHREDGPAVEFASGTKKWFINGIQIEEKDLPINKEKEWPKCTIDKDGNKIWKNKDGKLHRDDGPAIEYENGDKEWYINGKCHRLDGPAVEKIGGTKLWYKNGKYHREDGPAVELVNECKYWYKNGKIHREDGPAIERSSGIKEWLIDGTYHREGAPAVEGPDGYSEWWVNGKKHRIDGPAIRFSDGSKYWYKDGKKHREDGPAVEYKNSHKEYWLNGIQVEEKDLPINQEGEWPRCSVDEDGAKIWKNEKGQYHRTDGPALEYKDGSKIWYKDGLRHREDGPAVELFKTEYSIGFPETKTLYQEYWLNGELIKEKNLPINKFVTYKINENNEEWRNANGDLIENLEVVGSWIKGEKIKEKPMYTINALGTKIWKNEKGQHHRENGPACEYANGTKEWWINGRRHRENGPAIEFSSGSKEWFKDGERHREDGPAYDDVNGYKEWWIKGIRHREDGPAIEWNNGDKKWYKNGALHRENGPAVDNVNGYKEWWMNGQKHRDDGPAIEYANSFKEYWLNDKQVKEKDLPINKKEEWPKCTVDECGNKEWRNEAREYHREDGPAIESPNGNKYWYKDGKRHREDGPAIEWGNGDKYWYKDGFLHREDGPAIEKSKEKRWLIEGGLHREDGPAIEYASGTKEYWLNNIKVKEKDLPMNKEKELIKEEWPKCIIDKYGNKFWRNEKGQSHREDGPAVEQFSGNKYWYKNDKLHREDGPACEYSDGVKSYWLNGVQIEEKDLPINKEKESLINEECTINNGGNIIMNAGNVFFPKYIPLELDIKNPQPKYKSKSMTQIIKKDAKNCSYRIISKQITKIIRASFLSMISNKSQLNAATKFVNSEMGKSFISYLSGLIIQNIKSDKTKILAREMRVEGLSIAGNEITELLINQIFAAKSYSRFEQIEEVEAYEENELTDESIKNLENSVQ